jgi:hypothetical protein
MNSMRKKRLVTIHIPGQTTYDSDGFPLEEPETVKKVYCTITRVKPDELMTYNVDKLTEILRLTCPWSRVRDIEPSSINLTIDGKKYELWGPFINVDMLNIEAYFEAKRVT